jgi:thermolysin
VRRFRRVSIPILAAAALWAAATVQPAHGQGPRPQRVAAGDASMTPGTTNSAALAALRSWNTSVTAMTNAGQLRSIRRESDPTVAGRRHERLAQFHRGVRVFGGEMVRQTNFFGQVVSISGSYYPDIGIDVTPAVAAAIAPATLAAAGHGTVLPGTAPELTVLPLDDGTYRLTWSARVTTGGDLTRLFVDAMTGREVFSYDDAWAQNGLHGAVGSGTGVAGDPLKMQAQLLNGTYLAVDLNRPGQNTTYDMKGSFQRTNTILSTRAPAQSDIASDADNKWTDPAVIAVQTYAGYTYDYYKQVHNRSGIDGNNLRLRLLVNPAIPTDAAHPPAGADLSYYENAFYALGGYAVFGVGRISGQVVTKNWGGAIDIVAHEITHGVTEFTSNLIYLNESGALNESFSDMMGTAVEFRSQSLGTGPAKAEWLHGEDIYPTVGRANRSLSDPHSLGFPDHYSLRVITSADSGGVHTNSSISNHMFYLAINGGVNRVSGLAVQGVGFANRVLIERAVFRAFTLLMPDNSTFSTCRAMTIQAARDLYGSGSPAETALTQAWNAVGVF